MENAGKDDIPNEAERKGLGTPATRAAIIEKLVTAGFVERKGKNLIPTKAGINLVTILPEPLTSPMLTAEWEQKLTEIAKGGADPDTFMDGIRTMVQEIVSTYYDHNKDYPFAAFITNLGKYNEGELVGEWVKFPTTAEELKEVFKRIGIGQKDDFGQPYEE